MKRSRRTVIFLPVYKISSPAYNIRNFAKFLFYSRGRQSLYSAAIHRYNCSKNIKGNALYLVGGINF
jgi:hypothetical protein